MHFWLSVHACIIILIRWQQSTPQNVDHMSIRCAHTQTTCGMGANEDRVHIKSHWNLGFYNLDCIRIQSRLASSVNVECMINLDSICIFAPVWMRPRKKVRLILIEVYIVYGVHLVMVLCINQHLTGDCRIIQLLERVSHESCTSPPLQFTNDRTILWCSMINLMTGLGHLQAVRIRFCIVLLA